MEDKEEEDPFVYYLTNAEVSQPLKKKRGRPPKTKFSTTTTGASQVQQYHSKVMENIFNAPKAETKTEIKDESKVKTETKTETKPVKSRTTATTATTTSTTSTTSRRRPKTG